jgi:hypothetical protein
MVATTIVNYVQLVLEERASNEACNVVQRPQTVLLLHDVLGLQFNNPNKTFWILYFVDKLWQNVLFLFVDVLATLYYSH